MNDRRELFSVYPPELKSIFAPFSEKANEFVQLNYGIIATLFTDPREMQDYAKQLEDLSGTLVA